LPSGAEAGVHLERRAARFAQRVRLDDEQQAVADERPVERRARPPPRGPLGGRRRAVGAQADRAVQVQPAAAERPSRDQLQLPARPVAAERAGGQEGVGANGHRGQSGGFGEQLIEGEGAGAGESSGAAGRTFHVGEGELQAGVPVEHHAPGQLEHDRVGRGTTACARKAVRRDPLERVTLDGERVFDA